MKSIKLQKTQRALKELIPSALSNLNDELINGLSVTQVECKRGKYDAVVYLDPAMWNEEEKKQIVKKLKKVHSYIKNFCTQAEGWYRCPNFSWKWDESLQVRNDLDALFAQVNKELNRG